MESWKNSAAILSHLNMSVHRVKDIVVLGGIRRCCSRTNHLRRFLRLLQLRLVLGRHRVLRAISFHPFEHLGVAWFLLRRSDSGRLWRLSVRKDVFFFILIFLFGGLSS